MIGGSRIPKRRNPVAFLPVVGLAVLVGSCDVARESGDAAGSDEADWRIVQAYIDLDTAWHAKHDEIFRADHPAQERQRLLKEERGEHPDIVLAVGAAKAIVEADGEHAREAAKFLVEHPRGLSPTADQDIELGLAALKSIVGPDWSVVEALKTRQAEWEIERKRLSEADIPDDEKSERRRDLGPAPKDPAAIAAALAIAELKPAHERGLEAVEFLILPGVGGPAPEVVVMAAQSLADHFPDYGNWPTVLARMDSDRLFGAREATDAFIAEMATGASDPVVRATARYFAATGLMSGLNQRSIPADERDEMRRRALEFATGLSAGVEDEEFVEKRFVDGELVPVGLPEVEAEVVYSLHHATVGGTVNDETGHRLDGSEDKLSAYAGKVVLLDFWATWCGPCVGALPEIRELAAAYPKERFEILAISVDDEVETVTEFMEDEPMPWAHWHAGNTSELIGNWHVRVFPTYVVVDGDGRILSRSSDLQEAKAVVEETLQGKGTEASASSKEVDA